MSIPYPSSTLLSPLYSHPQQQQQHDSVYQYQQSYFIGSNHWSTDVKSDHLQQHYPLNYSQYNSNNFQNSYYSQNSVDVDVDQWDPSHSHFHTSQSHHIHPNSLPRLQQEDLAVYQIINQPPSSDQQQSYSQSAFNAYYDGSVQQDRYVHPIELSSPASLSPDLEYSQGFEHRFVPDNFQARDCAEPRCLVKDEEISNPDAERAHSDNASEGTNPDGDRDADADDIDLDAEGEDDPGDPEYTDEGDQDSLGDNDDDGDGEYIHRSRRSSSTALPTEGRTLRLRSSTISTRYSPYAFSPTQVSARPRRAYSNASVPNTPRSSMQSTLFGPNGTVGDILHTRRRARSVAPLPVPIPVPNLTKKSRGRRVPTVASMECGGRSGQHRGCHHLNMDGEGGKWGGTRMYTCKVNGCGKCFARGEHLKRHVRSIHTYEKPHKCPYPGCGKDFSRHDNLGQHMRVHKDFVGDIEKVPRAL